MPSASCNLRGSKPTVGSSSHPPEAEMPQEGPQWRPVTLVSLQLCLPFPSLPLRQSYFEGMGINFDHAEFEPVRVFPRSEQKHKAKPPEAGCCRVLQSAKVMDGALSC